MPRLPSDQRQPTLDSSAKEIGSRIASLRKAKGITQRELAEKIGVTRTVVTDYECGRVRMYDEMLARLALVLECSTDTILGLKNTVQASSAPQLRFTRRIRELEQLPEQKQKAILKTLDDLIRANQ
jgi:transcriptional regulator with XRE-family HTH domain